MPTSEAMTQVIKTRIRMTLPSQENQLVFFGHLAVRLRLRETDAIPTWAVDGTTLYFNPKFTCALTKENLNFVMAHEVMHCALLHPYRRGSRDPKLWNIATDYAINYQLIECHDSSMVPPAHIKVDGKEVFSEVLYHRKFGGMTAEAIYDELLQDCVMVSPSGGKGQELDDCQSPKPKLGDTDGDGDGDEDGSGKGKDGREGDGDSSDGAGNDPGMSELDWAQSVADAKKRAQEAGKLPGNIARNIDAEHEPELPWKAILARFITRSVPSDYTWMRPNRRFAYQGLYMPGVHKENIGELVVCVDMSGSITDDWLATTGSELRSLCMLTKPEKVHVLYFDTVVSHHDVYTSYHNLELGAHGGGGTAFQPFFDFVQSPENKIKPIALICFTDLYCGDSPKDPGYPVLWVVPKGGKVDFPFGQVLPV